MLLLVILNCDFASQKDQQSVSVRGQDGTVVDRLSSDLRDRCSNPGSDEKVFFSRFESDV